MGALGWDLGLWDLLAALFYALIIGLPGVFFLLTLRGLLAALSEQSGRLAPNTVWLHLIPGFNLGWFIYTVVRLRDSIQREFFMRGWEGDRRSTYRMGIAAGILLICLVALGWAPFVNFLTGLALVVCGGLYWVRVAVLRRQLEEAGPLRLHPISPPPFMSEVS
jgi:hypothetical protein